MQEDSSGYDPSVRDGETVQNLLKLYAGDGPVFSDRAAQITSVEPILWIALRNLGEARSTPCNTNLIDVAAVGGVYLSMMAHSILTTSEAQTAAREPGLCYLWVRERDSKQFAEPGWVKLEPPRNGGVLFVHRDREALALRGRRAP